MKTTWFKRWGWFYLPVTLPGAVVVFAALAFCAQVFLVVDRNCHSVSDTFYGVFPFFTGSFLLYDWLARRTSGPTD